MTNNREFSNLPRKYKISVSGCCIRCAQPDINCCGLFGLKRGEEAGYGIMVGGGLSSAPHLAQMLPFFIKPEQVWPVVKAVSEIFRDEGYRLKRNRARFKFLVADWGVEKMAAAVQDALDFKLDAHTDFDAPKDQETDHLGIHAQKQPGLYWVGVNFAGGRIRSGQAWQRSPTSPQNTARPGQDAIRLTAQAKPADAQYSGGKSSRAEGGPRRRAARMIRRISARAAFPAPALSSAILPWPRPRTA